MRLEQKLRIENVDVSVSRASPLSNWTIHLPSGQLGSKQKLIDWLGQQIKSNPSLFHSTPNMETQSDGCPIRKASTQDAQ